MSGKTGMLLFLRFLNTCDLLGSSALGMWLGPMAIVGHLVAGQLMTWLAVWQMSVHCCKCKTLKDARHHNQMVLKTHCSLHSGMQPADSLAETRKTVWIIAALGMSNSPLYSTMALSCLKWISAHLPQPFLLSSSLCYCLSLLYFHYLSFCLTLHIS